jgi:signal transduction histidine kinase
VDIEIAGENPIVEVDAEQLQIALMNLMLNAAQAAGEAGRVRVSIRATDGQCAIEVSDSGPGISAEALAKIFEPFFTTKHRGTGLGLPVAKRVIEMHQGKMEVVSPPGGGAVVRISLPVRPAE